MHAKGTVAGGESFGFRPLLNIIIKIKFYDLNVSWKHVSLTFLPKKYFSDYCLDTCWFLVVLKYNISTNMAKKY